MKKILTAAAAAMMSLVSAHAMADGSLSAGANKTFLEQNAHKPGVTVTKDGLQYQVIKPGSGASPAPTDTVDVRYSGSLIDGKVFDKTGPNQVARFPVNHLIPGWTEALTLMKPGAQWHVVIPANLAYGAKGAGDVIPPNQTLVFDMTLVAVHHGE